MLIALITSLGVYVCVYVCVSAYVCGCAWVDLPEAAINISNTSHKKKSSFPSVKILVFRQWKPNTASFSKFHTPNPVSQSSLAHLSYTIFLPTQFHLPNITQDITPSHSS